MIDMTLATCAKDVRFYKWPNISYIGIYETPVDCMSVRSISWSCDGKELLVVKSKGCPVILDAPVKSEQCSEPYECSYIDHASVGDFSNKNPDIIAFGMEDGYIMVYNIKHPRRPQECVRLPGPIQNLEFSADDRFLAAGCASGPIVLFNSSYKPCASFLIPNSPSLSTLATSKLVPNLLAGASKDGVLSLWNIESTDNLFTSKQHNSRVTDITFFNNGLSSVGIDGKFVSYDLRTYQACCCELDSPLSSLSYLIGTYEVAVSTVSGQLRSYDSRNMKSPLKTLIAIANGSIKKISFPVYRDPYSLEYNVDFSGKSVDDDFSASGDFSIASGSSPRRSHLDGNRLQPTSESPTHTSSNAIADEHLLRRWSSENLEEYNKLIEVKLKHATKDFEEKLIQTFYRLRISTSKQFINLEEKISQNWNNFVDYLKFSGQGLTTCPSGIGVQKSADELDLAAISTQILNNGKLS